MDNKYAVKKWEVRRVQADCKSCGAQQVQCIGINIDYQYGVMGVSSWVTLCEPCMELLEVMRDNPDVNCIADYFPPYNHYPVVTYGHVKRQAWYDDWM